MAPFILRRKVLLLVLLSLTIFLQGYVSSTDSVSCTPHTGSFLLRAPRSEVVASHRCSSRRYWGEEEEQRRHRLLVQTGRFIWADAANTAKSKPKDSYSSTKNRKRDEPKKEDGNNNPPRQRSAKSRIPKDLYELLEVPRSATAKQIKSAYRKVARKYHPDVNQDDPLAKERFQAINKAYAVLQDPDKRSVYDQTGMTDEEMAAGGGGPQSGAAGGGFRGRGGGGPSPFQSFTGTHFGEDYQWGFGRPPPQQWGRRDHGEPPFGGGFASQKARGSPSAAGQQQQQRERKFSFESMFTTTKNSATQPSSKNTKPPKGGEDQGEKTSSGGMFGSLFGSLFGSSTKRTVSDDNEGDARQSSQGKSRSDQRSQRTHTSPGAEERPRSSTSSSHHKRGTAGRNSGGGESADREGKPKFHSKPSREDLHEKFNTKKNGHAEFDEADAPPKEFFFQQGNNGPDDMDPSSNPHFARWFAKKFGQGPMGGDMGGNGGGGGGPFGGGGGGFSSKSKSSPKGAGGGGSSSSSSQQSKKPKPKKGEEDYSSRTSSQQKAKETKKPKTSPTSPEKKPQPAGTVWRFDRSLFESACLAAGRGGAAKRCVLLYGASSTFQSGEALFREVSAELHRDLHTPLFFVDRHEIRNVTEAVKASVRDIIRDESLDLTEDENVKTLQWDRARWCASHAPVGDHRLAKTAPALVGEYCLWTVVHRPQKSSLKFAAVGKFPDLPKTTTTTTQCATKATAGDDECDTGSSAEQQRPLPGANAVKSLRNAKDVLQAVQRLADGSDVSWAHATTV